MCHGTYQREGNSYSSGSNTFFIYSHNVLGVYGAAPVVTALAYFLFGVCIRR